MTILNYSISINDVMDFSDDVLKGQLWCDKYSDELKKQTKWVLYNPQLCYNINEDQDYRVRILNDKVYFIYKCPGTI